MVTLLFIFIAFLMRKRFLPEDATRGDKVLYYIFSVVLTPLIGPWLFKLLDSSESCDSNDSKNRHFGYTYPGFL